VREGVEDGWYLKMLEWALERAAGPSKATEKAVRLLERLKMRVPLEFSRYFGRARRYDPQPGPPKEFSIKPEEMAAIREEVATAIADILR
jgi:hypothetical protein